MKNPAVSIALVLALTSISHAAITAVSLGGDGSSLPVAIDPLSTTISANAHDVSERYSFNSSNSDAQFVRHIESEEDNICYYWFRSTEDPTIWTNTEQYSDVYWYVFETCIFVDGAETGDNNFVLLRNGSGMDVGVLQFRFTEPSNPNLPSPAVLLAYAVNPEGLTFAEGVAAIQAIPEPSSAMLGAAAVLAGISRRRRR